MKLTEAQKAALAAMPFTVIMWGGKPFSGMPKGVRQSTLSVLLRQKLANVGYNGTRESWDITPAGRATLKEAQE